MHSWLSNSVDDAEQGVKVDCLSDDPVEWLWTNRTNTIRGSKSKMPLDSPNIGNSPAKFGKTRLFQEDKTVSSPSIPQKLSTSVPKLPLPIPKPKNPQMDSNLQSQQLQPQIDSTISNPQVDFDKVNKLAPDNTDSSFCVKWEKSALWGLIGATTFEINQTLTDSKQNSHFLTLLIMPGELPLHLSLSMGKLSNLSVSFLQYSK